MLRFFFLFYINLFVVAIGLFCIISVLLAPVGVALWGFAARSMGNALQSRIRY